MNSARMSRWALVLLLATTAFTGAPRQRAEADEASGKLEAYNKAVDQAIEKGLKFLASKQLKDGSFESRMRGNTAVTSLAVMAFLARGHTPETGPYADVINKGIDYIVSCRQKNGMLIKGGNGPMYSHCISTLMLSEVSGMVSPERQKRIDVALAKALKLILTAQQVKKPAGHQGGWRYGPTSGDSDISVTGWAMLALRSARNAGTAIPKKAIDDGVKYILKLRCSDGGFGYSSPGGPGLARTGVALLCLELCGKHGDKAAEGAGKWILSHLPSLRTAHFYYALYYCSQGMFQLGGQPWETYAQHMYKMMLKAQLKDGSWPLVANAGGAGPCYSTAMTLLAMSVTYRQLPIYQR